MKEHFLKIPFIVTRNIIEFFIIYMPGQFGTHLRYVYYKRKLKACGKNVVIDVGVIFSGIGHISVGDNVYIDKYCVLNAGDPPANGKIRKIANPAYGLSAGQLYLGSNIHIAQFCVIMAYGGVSVGDNCALSAGTKIYSLTNTPADPDDHAKVISIMPLSSPEAPFLLSPVVLSDNVWVALNCIVMPGVCVGRDSFAASNSVLMGRFQENSYIGGNPAVKQGNRFK